METNRFHGSRCISCGEVFVQGDDIVVCPECGTPYHRECYKKEGSCINHTLHDSGLAWKPVTEEEAAAASHSESGRIRCMRCGEENDVNGIFCLKCGLPLHQNEPPERPFNEDYKNNYGQQVPPGQFSSDVDRIGDRGFTGTVALDKNTEIDGIKLEDYATYVRVNVFYFITNFFRFFKLKTKLSFNFGAVLFPHFYFLFRKMYGVGALMLLLSFVLGIPSFIYMGTQDVLGQGQVFIKNAGFVKGDTFELIYTVCEYVSFVLRLGVGFFANYIYYSSVKKNIKKIRSEASDDTSAKQVIAQSGGVSWPAVIVGFTALFGLFTVLMLVVNIMM